MTISKMLLASTCSIAAFTSNAAFAQTAAPATEAAQTTSDDIVVTAQKRSENVQKVPVAVSVISPSALTNAGAVNLQDMAKVAPSLTITPESQPANTSIILRGVGTFAFSIAVEPAVAVIIDDVPQAYQAQALTTDLGDVDRVEVLRGPQSTLFGKSASAGVINIVTKAPTNTFTGAGSAMVTTDDEYRVSGTISGPITNTLRFRLTAARSDYDGSGRNLTSNTPINGLAQTSAKLRLNWTPISGLTIDAGGTYDRVRADCCTAAYIALDPNAKLLSTNFTGAQVTRGETVNGHNRDVRLDSPLYSNSDFYAESLKIGYDFDSGLNLMSITSHQLFNLKSGVDNDFSDLDIIGARSGGTVAGKYVQMVNTRAETFTQELRLTSPNTGPFKYVAGLYYQSFDGGAHFRRGPFLSVGSYDAYSTSKNYAAFGQATYDLADTTRLIGGLRVAKEDISYSFFKNTTGEHFGRSNSDTAVTGKAALQHDFAADVMGYVSYTRGYKGQAYDLTSVLNTTIANAFPIKAEHSNSYEAGLRTRFADRRITLNLTGFWTDYDNFQAQGLLPDISISPVLANVGSVRTRGFELEGSGRISSMFRLNGGLAFTDAKIRSYPNSACYPNQSVAQGCVNGVFNEKGQRLPNAPKWKLNIGGDLTVPLGDSVPFDGTINAYYVYQSKVVYALTNDPATAQSGYGIVNLAAGLSGKGNDFKVSLFVNNLFDKQYYTRIDNRTSLFGNATAIAGYLPRDFRRYGGIRVSAGF